MPFLIRWSLSSFWISHIHVSRPRSVAPDCLPGRKFRWPYLVARKVSFMQAKLLCFRHFPEALACLQLAFALLLGPFGNGFRGRL